MTTKYYDASTLYNMFERPFYEDHLIKTGYYNSKGAKKQRKLYPEPVIERPLPIGYDQDWYSELPKHINTERFVGMYTTVVNSLYIQSSRVRDYNFYIWTPELHSWVTEMNKLFGTNVKPKYLRYDQYLNIKGIDKYLSEEEVSKLK